MIENRNLPVLKTYRKDELIRGNGRNTYYLIPSEWIESEIWIHCRKLDHYLNKINKTPQDWYDRWILNISISSERPKCPICGKDSQFRGIYYNYSISCASKSCLLKVRGEGIKLSHSLNNFGERISEILRKSHSDPKSGFNSIECNQRRSIGLKNARSNPNSGYNTKEYRTYLRNHFSNLWKDPNSNYNSDSYRKKLSDAQKFVWSNPGIYSVFHGSHIVPFSYCGIHISMKSGAQRYQSSWELEFYKSLDENELVKSYYTQPFPIPYLWEDGSYHSYFPDCLIKYIDGHKELVEIKPSCFVNDEINQLKFEAGRRYALENNLTFKIVTENEIFN